mgnify:CR=1 FL=1
MIYNNTIPPATLLSSLFVKVLFSIEKIYFRMFQGQTYHLISEGTFRIIIIIDPWLSGFICRILKCLAP